MNKLTKTALLLSASLSGSYYAFVDYVFKLTFSKDKNFFIGDFKLLEKDHEYFDAQEWYETCRVEDFNLSSFDGLNLYGHIIENNPDSDKYIVLVHGSMANYKWMLRYAKDFSSRGFNLLVYDQRCCGQSEGEYITYGQKESLDLLQMIDYLVKRKPNAKICLFGVSLGGAAVCMASSTKLIPNVKCSVSDCAFDDFRTVVTKMIKQYTSFPSSAIIASLNVYLKQKLDISFKEMSPKLLIKNCKTPILFIHGDSDEIVDYNSLRVLYNNCGSEVRKCYTVKGAKHAKSYKNPNYFTNVTNFIKKYMED